jgi:Phage Terminase
MTEPLDLVASVVLDDGARWGERATAEQWADMHALLAGAEPRRHYWLRARGRSKTFDAGAATLAVMLAGGLAAGDEMYAAAAGRDQAALIARKIRGISERTPELRGAIEVHNYRLATPRSGVQLDVVSADLSTSWGRTPRWLFIDELPSHERGEIAQTFVESLLTSLPKRADSQCLAVGTPSSPSHWAYGLWETAEADPLWRTSLVSGPAPWQDPAELQSERRRLPESLWRRLFLCEWCEADDALADAGAVAECIRHDGPLDPQPGVRYVVAFDLSTVSDHTAVLVAHVEEAGTGRMVVVDRLAAWKPSKAHPVDMAAVEAYVAESAREYNGAAIHGDPWQAVSMVQRLRQHHQVTEVTFSAGANSRRAQQLLRLIRDRALDLPDDPDLRRELLSLRLTEGSSPGVLKLTAESGTVGHFDRVTALMIASEALLSRPLSRPHTPGSVFRWASAGDLARLGGTPVRPGRRRAPGSQDWTMNGFAPQDGDGEHPEGGNVRDWR